MKVRAGGLHQSRLCYIFGGTGCCMTPERWRKIEEVYQAARERKPGDRNAFLAEASGDDPELQREVESLLAADLSHDSLLDHPVWIDAGTTLTSSATASAAPAGHWFPGNIGHYRILRMVGEGGMGAVYEAEQEQPRRIVALKIIKPGL